MKKKNTWLRNASGSNQLFSFLLLKVLSTEIQPMLLSCIKFYYLSPLDMHVTGKVSNFPNNTAEPCITDS